MEYAVPHYINGEKKVEQDTALFSIHNPKNGEAIGKVGFASESICKQAILAAQNAWESWRETPTLKRAQILFQFRALLEKKQSELAEIVTREHGKTLEDAKGSVLRAIELVDFHCNLTRQLQGSISMNIASQVDCYSIRQPLGVCFGVSPFNFPIMVPVWMMIPAIAYGNTFILKPSEQAPSATVRIMELLTEAGLPKGVANCVHGDKATVDYFLKHPAIQACTAVASTPVAQSIYQTAIAHGKRAHTFGGAKNHCVVMPDADFEHAAKSIVAAAFGAAGERCMAISVVVTVNDNTAKKLMNHLLPLVKAIKVDAGDSDNVDMGPLVSAAHRSRVLKAIAAGVSEGAKLVVDGRHFRHPQYPEGYYIGPCLFEAVTESMSIYQNEIFGPVLVVISVKDFNTALDLVNRHQFGNGTAIFTENGYAAREFAMRVQVGMVGINIPIPVPIVNHPFGGWKRSFFGDISMHGEESIRFYTLSKSITSKWLSTSSNHIGFSMPIHQ